MGKSTFGNSRAKVLEYLGNASGVRMSTSATLKGFVDKDYIVVHDAPPAVFAEIARRFQYVSISADAGGILIPTYVPDNS